MPAVSGTALAICIASVGLTGCAATVDYRPGRPTKVIRAPFTGVYELYPRGKHEPVYNAVLLRGDRVGFVHDSQGRLVALADTQREVLREGKYRWRFDADPGDSGGLAIRPGDVFGALSGLLLEVVVDCGLDLAAHEVDKAIDPGLTMYQRKKLERHSADHDP